MPRPHMHGGDIYRSRPPPIRITADNKETTADALERLARMVRNLIIDRRDPERFHEDKSEIEAELLRLLRSPLVTPPPKIRLIPGPERVVAVERVVLVKLFRPPRRRQPGSGAQLELQLDYPPKPPKSP